MLAELRNLGSQMSQSQRFSEAETLYREALDLSRKLWGHDNSKHAGTALSLVDCLAREKRNTTRPTWFLASFSIQRELDGPRMRHFWQAGPITWLIAGFGKKRPPTYARPSGCSRLIPGNMRSWHRCWRGPVSQQPRTCWVNESHPLCSCWLVCFARIHQDDRGLANNRLIHRFPPRQAWAGNYHRSCRQVSVLGWLESL